MSRFLTDAWLRDLADAASAAETPGWPEGERLVIQQVVTGTRSLRIGDDEDDGRTDAAEGDTAARDVTRWALVISADGVRVIPGGDPDPDLVLVADFRTASAIARGTLNAQQALAAGTLRVCGDLTRLATLHDPLTVLGDLFATLRATTEIPDL